MITNYTADNLVQQTMAEYLEHPLGWESVCSSHNVLSLSCIADGEMTL
jgi:hypothetical protein